MYSPHNILVFAELGNEFELTGQNAAAYVRNGEEVSYWQLQVGWHMLSTFCLAAAASRMQAAHCQLA